MKSYITQMCVSVDLDENNDNFRDTLLNCFIEIEKNDLLPREIFLSSDTQKLLLSLCAKDGYFKLQDYTKGLEIAKYKIDDSIKYKRIILISEDAQEATIKLISSL